MTTHCPAEQLSIEAEAGKSWVQVSFLAIAILFNLCLVAQLLTVGLAIFADASWWQIHIWLVRGYGGLAVLLFVGKLITPFPKRIQALTNAIVMLLLLQFVTAHVQQPTPRRSASAHRIHLVYHIDNPGSSSDGICEGAFRQGSEFRYSESRYLAAECLELEHIVAR